MLLTKLWIFTSRNVNVLLWPHYSIVKVALTFKQRRYKPDRLSSESSSSSSSSRSSDSLLAGRRAVGLNVSGIPTPGIPTPGILTPGIPIPACTPLNRSTSDCARWFWKKPFKAAKGPVAWVEVVGGCDRGPAWVVPWVLLDPVLRSTGIDPASESHWGKSLRGLLMRAKGASWVVLWMTPLGWWGSRSPSRALERKRLEWLSWGGGSGAGGNGDEDRDVLLGDLFGPCCCFFSSAGNVCPWDIRVWE